jgi:hypothetical protein
MVARRSIPIRRTRGFRGAAIAGGERTAAWRTPQREIAVRCLARGGTGISYRAYTLEILERGRYL